MAQKFRVREIELNSGTSNKPGLKFDQKPAEASVLKVSATTGEVEYAILPNVVQTTGQSTTDVMSQKAVTDELEKKVISEFNEYWMVSTLSNGGNIFMSSATEENTRNFGGMNVSDQKIMMNLWANGYWDIVLVHLNKMWWYEFGEHSIWMIDIRVSESANPDGVNKMANIMISPDIGIELFGNEHWPINVRWVATPENPNDAANKAYVDNKISTDAISYSDFARVSKTGTPISIDAKEFNCTIASNGNLTVNAGTSLYPGAVYVLRCVNGATAGALTLGTNVVNMWTVDLDIIASKQTTFVFQASTSSVLHLLSVSVEG